MKILRSVVTLALLLLVLLAVVGLVWTRGSGPEEGTPVAGRRAPLVDEQPLRTARDMAKLVSSWDEQRLAQQALKLADHEVDLDFAAALRDATENPAPRTPESRELYERLNKAEAVVKAEQSRVDELKKSLAGAPANHKEVVQQQLDIAQAQLGLDQDEADDAKEDLVRSGADPLSRIQRQFNRYQTAQQADTNRQVAPVAPSAAPAKSLVSRFSAWRVLRVKEDQLLGAENEASQNVVALKKKHDILEKQVEAEQSGQQALTQAATDQLASAGADGAGGVFGETTAALSTLHSLSIDQKSLSDLDRRIQNHQELHDVYAKWFDLAKSNERNLLHNIVKSALWILLIILAVYLIDQLVDRLLAGSNLDHSRFRTLRIIVKFVLQAVGVLLILLVIFGTPDQMPTILGLATAGLTVALKDFIIAFIGWFVLMGRNGIHPGDWVEINGVVGEVVEVNLLRTVLLETGNWNDSGHPTGRKVAFMNGFAIEGHFFNFSTSGQWLWDELQIMIPSDQDPYPVIQAIQKMVTQETEENARMAEDEWKKATGRYRVRSVSATPAVNLRPTTSGVEVHIRYITRANERYATRTRLYQDLVGLLRGRGVEPSSEVAATEPARK
jgi:small-conductance mechanosensitive channel